MKHLLDLEAYPIDKPESAEYAALVESCRTRLAADGMFELLGFLKDNVVRAAVDLATPAMANDSHRHARMHNVYFRDTVEGLSDADPVMAKVETVNHTLCADQLTGNPIMALYDWKPFSDFLAATMGKDVLYTMEDPMARVNVQASRDGEALNWHFDRSEFTTTILLQAPEQGGELEYRKDLRSKDDPNHAGVAAVHRLDQPARAAAVLLLVAHGSDVEIRPDPVGRATLFGRMLEAADRPGRHPRSGLRLSSGRRDLQHEQGLPRRRPRGHRDPGKSRIPAGRDQRHAGLDDRLAKRARNGSLPTRPTSGATGSRPRRAPRSKKR